MCDVYWACRRVHGVHFSPAARDSDGLGFETMADAEWFRQTSDEIAAQYPDTPDCKHVLGAMVRWSDGGNTSKNRSSHVCLTTMANFSARGKVSPAGKVFDTKRT